MRQHHISRINVALLAVTMLLVGLTVGSGFNQPPQQQACAPQQCTPPASSSAYSVSMIVPAVDDRGNGVATGLRVDERPGSGKILANIDQLLFVTDTQQSIQIARDIAVGIAGIDMKSIDIIYAIDTPSNVTVVGGPSAGAAFTIATIAALEHKTPRPDVAITGTINADGSIGQVGGALEKAGAAKERGIKLFLVPTGQGTQIVTKPVETCSREPASVICEITYNKTTINIGASAGIEVREVANIREAAALFGL